MHINGAFLNYDDLFLRMAVGCVRFATGIKRRDVAFENGESRGGVIGNIATFPERSRLNHEIFPKKCA